MKKSEIEAVVNNAFDLSFQKWSKAIEKELYPSAFSDEHSWLRVKNSFEINNSFLKDALKGTLSELLKDK